jgi:hypothetical protein
VYKKWIGSADREADVEIRLYCATGGAADAGRDLRPESNPAADPGPRRINEDKPAGWDLGISDPDGLECYVLEMEREDFRADISDCQDLIIVPGTNESAPWSIPRWSK